MYMYIYIYNIHGHATARRVAVGDAALRQPTQ